MVRWMVLVSMMLGVGGWLRNAGPDAALGFGTSSIAAPGDVHVMDGADPFPH
jgi:hypothetical protein